MAVRQADLNHVGAVVAQQEVKCYARGVSQVNRNQQRTKWLDELYPEIKRGPHSTVRAKQRGAFMMGYELAVRDMKERLWEKILEEGSEHDPSDGR